MSDIFQGRTYTESYKFVSDGTEKNLEFSIDFDEITFINLTKWTGTAGGSPISKWFKGQTTAGHAFQQKVIDSAEAQSFNFVDTATNGFTVANTSGGPVEAIFKISAVTKANPVVVTTITDNGFQTGQTVMITDLGGKRGMDQINNMRYKIVVLTPTMFSLQDIVTGDPIDSTNFTTYVSGGRIALETRVIRLNNPSTTNYNANPYVYNSIRYILTVGTAVMGSNADIFRVNAIKWGDTFDLGQL